MDTATFPETFAPGTRVRITATPTSNLLTTKWWPKSSVATGTVERTFKNGKVAVAIDQVRNFSDDGKVTQHFTPANVTLEEIR